MQKIIGTLILNGPTFVAKVVDFFYAHWEEFINLYPRTEALETPIEVTKETVETPWYGKRVVTQIKEVDNNNG